MTEPSDDLELDSRLLLFAEKVRIRSEMSVVVEGNRVLVGTSPNCAILFVNGQDNKIWVSFHRECHPLSVITLTLMLLDIVDHKDLHFSYCFLSDVKGVISYESDIGFDLLHIQYLRDILGFRQKNIASA